LHGGPSRQRARPLLHQRRGVRLLQFVEDRRRNHHLPEKSGKDGFGAAQNKVVQRRSIRDNNAHERVRILSSVTLSASKSAAE
jgi:hypothetical protein